MKKIISVVLLLALILSSVPAASAFEVVFTAVNDSFLDLKYENMPLYVGSQLYVPYSVLSGELGLYATYTAGEKVLVVFNNNHSLIFDMAHGETRDEKGNVYTQTATMQNGRVYVPLAFICWRFGFTYSLLSNDKGRVLRIKSPSAVLSDSIFVYLGRDVMSEMLTAYNRQPPQTPPDDGSPNTPATARKTVYLTFDGDLNKWTEKILSALSSAGYKATFFVAGQSIRENDDLFRQLYTSGHALGICGFSGTAEEFSDPAAAVGAVRSSNLSVDGALMTKLRLVRLPVGAYPSAGIKSILEENGYILWGFTDEVDDTGKNNTSARVGRAAKSIISGSRGTIVLRLHSTEATAGAITEILEYLRDQNCTVLPVNEWDDPIA